MKEYERKNRIKEALILRNMKQVELAKRTGFSETMVSSWTKHRWQPKQIAIYKMAKVLNVSEMWLAGYDTQIERPVEQLKMDELTALIHILRNNERMTDLCNNISNLSEENFEVVEKLVKQLNK